MSLTEQGFESMSYFADVHFIYSKYHLRHNECTWHYVIVTRSVLLPEEHVLGMPQVNAYCTLGDRIILTFSWIANERLLFFF